MKAPQLIVLLGIVSIGCGNSDSKPAAKKTAEANAVKVTAENQKSLFPFAVGNTWSYSMEVNAEAVNRPRQSINGVLTYTITKVTKDSATSSRAMMQVTRDGKKQDEQEWLCDDKGIYQTSMKAGQPTFSPRQPVILFPAGKEGNFKWEGTGTTPVGKPGQMTYAYKNDGLQTVDTEMGSMTGVFMQSVGSFKTNDGLGGAIGVNAWYSPGVGLIRYRQDLRLKDAVSSIVLRLKSYNVKK